MAAWADEVDYVGEWTPPQPPASRSTPRTSWSSLLRTILKRFARSRQSIRKTCFTLISYVADDSEKQTHKKAAVSAKLAQDEEEARAQAAVAAKRKQAATLEGCVHLGKVKQKPVDPRRWVKGVHQIVLWVGTARQGKGASKGRAQGKGAGAAVAERYPKAKTKGKKW